jgi:pyruvate/2-oxoglutarate dehydrogenase complex dihydrolipoamide dehydrogenase (E3) component
MTQKFDSIVIGAGQAGPSLTSRLTASGMKVALIERDKFGGTCVNTGCMPTKTLVASAYAAHLARRSADFGVVLDQPVRIDMRKVRSRAATVTANSSKGVENWLRNMKGCAVFIKVLADPSTKQILGASILGTSGDEAIHGILDAINAKTPYDQLRWAVPIHPTVSELIPTLLLGLQPTSAA